MQKRYIFSTYGFFQTYVLLLDTNSAKSESDLFIDIADLNEQDSVSVGKRFSMDKKVDSSGLRLLEICKEANLRIVNGRAGDDKGIGNYTFQSVLGRSVIDYILLPPRLFDRISNFFVHDITVLSDHAPLQLFLNLSMERASVSENIEVKTIKWNTSKIGDFRGLLQSSLNQLQSTIDGVVSGNCSIDEGVDTFASMLYDNAFQVFGQVKRVSTDRYNSHRKYTSPWFTRDCEIARAELKQANKMFRKNGKHELHLLVVEKRKNYSRVKRRARSLYNRNNRQKLHEMASNNPKAFWREIRRMKGDDQGGSKLSLQDFFEHFKDVYSENSNFTQNFVEDFVSDNLSGTDSDTHIGVRNLDTSSLDAAISVNEVIKAVSHLKRNKSPGIDLLPPELFIDSVDLIGNMLCKLFNYIFSNSIYPSSWTKGLVVPLPKKGDKNIVNNYRGITLTSIFSKIYSQILDLRLRTWAESNNIISDSQFGFRQKKSTIDCLFILQAIVNKQLSKKKKLYCAFIDFKKAFDLVYRNGIWYKLCQIGVSLKFVKSIKAIYNSVKVCVKSLGKLSDSFDSLVGVKQGEPLSPLLFILFLNDLSSELDMDVDTELIIEEFQKFVLLFADDTLLLAETLPDLQNLLNKLSSYCDNWNITVNTDKTKVLVFKRSSRPEDFDIFYGNERLDVVRNFIYLGVNVTSNGNFSHAQKHLSEQASKALYSLGHIFDTNVLCVNDKLKLFDSLILPILNYGSEIWSFSKSQDAERIHLKFLKQILGVRKQTCNLAVYGELGRVPLSVLHKTRVLKYWFKILSTPQSLIYKVYNQQVVDVNNGSNDNSWALNLKRLLDSLGFQFLWINQSMSRSQLNMVLQAVYDQFLQSWYADVGNTSKLSVYRLTDKHFKYENYLNDVVVEKHKIALSRFRTAAHKLMVEEGRYRGIDKNLRICQFCNANIVEDEYHFLLVCPMYREQRIQLLPKYYCRWPSTTKFKMLLNETRVNVVKNLAKFLYVATDKRTSILNSITSV